MSVEQSAPDPARVRIVLCSTTHPGNIGAAARAMKTMGLRELYLVTPRRFPDADATARAVGAADLLDQAVVCATLDEALAGCRFVVGMSARRRDLSHEVLSLRASAQRCARELGSSSGSAAYVFGTEMSGLSNAELELCSIIANIPTDPDFGSLNLGSAVQLAAYEVRQATSGDHPLQPYPQALARHEDVEALFAHLERTLHDTGFLRPERPKRLMQRLRRLLVRTRLEHEEVSLLRGLLRSFDANKRLQARQSLEQEADSADNPG